MSRLVVGCGYLGRRVARRWREAGFEVAGVVLHEGQGREIAREGIRPVVADVTQPETLRSLPPAETVLYAVGYDPLGGKSRREVYTDGLRHVLDALGPDTRRVLLISSTGVYGEAGGGWVDEDSPCRPTREAGRALLAAEQLLATHPLGRGGIVLRMAGLYGPGRLPQSAELLSGRPLAVAPGCWVNLIHVEDAASVAVAAEARAVSPTRYVVSDGCPVNRREYLTRLAEVLGAPRPTFTDAAGPGMPGSRRGAGDKRVNNARMLRDLGVRLAYPSYREGLAASVG